MMSEALNPIRALMGQARSYGRSVAGAGIRAAKAVTRDALGSGLKYYAAGGAIAGGAIGGYDDYSRGGNGIRGALRGAVLGAAGGAAIRGGMSAYGQRRSLGALGARIGGRVGGVGTGAARAAGGTNYFRNMATEFKMAGGFGAVGTGMKGAAKSAYRGAYNAGARAARSPMAGRAAGYARSGVARAARGASSMIDKGMYYAGL